MSSRFGMIGRLGVIAGILEAFLFLAAFAAEDGGEAAPEEAQALLAQLKGYDFNLVFEHNSEGNWELYRMNVDGSATVNLTNTPDVNEMYPHVSPDGAKVVFVVEEGDGDDAVRSVYFMNMDGSDRTLVAKHAREACWRADSRAIAYLGSDNHAVETSNGPLGGVLRDDPRFSVVDYATNGIFIYDLDTGISQQHPNRELHHLYNLCWSPDGEWFVATVHAGMGYNHTNLFVEANGMKVFDLGLGGCRPDISPDGTKLAWGRTDYDLHIADIDVSGGQPRISNEHKVASSPAPTAIYHVDWSPDGKYIAFSCGPHVKKLGLPPEMVGADAPGWNIGVCPAEGFNRLVMLTHDGNSNKEPDWAPAEKAAE